VLGIFGREGLLMANYWGNGPGVGELPEFIQSAFALYRNYDGKAGKFGDTAVDASLEDPQKASIYAATDSKSKQLTLVVINKDLESNVLGKIKIGGATQYKTAQGYRFDATSPALKSLPRATLQGNVLEQRLPRLSATLYVLEP
jgi:mannan endo-1,4-beta-mannosidase